MINVLIADDQNFVRKTLESYLEPESDLNVVGFAENGETAIDRVASLKPDVVLMDIEMPVMDGLAATKTITEKFAETKVLMLTIRDREQDVARALKLGAKGYWLKNTTAKELADAIRHVHNGYFQLALQLVEKHFEQAVTTNSESKQDRELNNKLNIVDKVLAKIEQKMGLLEELTPQNLNETVENLVKQEMTLRRERDENFQFRVDSLKHSLNRLKTKINFAIKAQLIYNLVLMSTVLALGYFLTK
jgi:DNA-binding NarL/FixJ family response regulator